ncbi:2-oxo acid dehydrogenase subunit E2 [Protofrankia sp. BMG5.30]|uniref:2-oxo acid dehydrogenase subunit E2 n=1 Tax=Protofrankia sp. BMG5.30 TaxID=1834514 RepID=UPI000976A071|nr:2-oxo acid dehydrogenase subunit E2 [Protofrankia sp. BMG5.30]ONH34909.1 acyltransferase [Protofrankia sp. BMG5.30]
MTITELARQRRHTLFFLRETRGFAPVFLDTEVDMSRLRALRSQDSQARHSTVTYVLYVAGRVLANHPEANAAILDGRRPRTARYPAVHGKVTLDKTIDGHRVVLATVVPDLERRSLAEIQQHVERFRDGDPATMPEFGGVRRLHAARSWTKAARAFRRVVRPLETRPTVWGTVAVTSLGHRPVDSFHSVGGTTITLGLGRTVDRPVARDGRVVVAPVLRLSLAFDHRVIDGAEAADVLAEIKEGLETFPWAVAPAASRPAAATRPANTQPTNTAEPTSTEPAGGRTPVGVATQQAHTQQAQQSGGGDA